MKPELVALLACPLEPSRPPLQLVGEYLVCSSCGRGFPIHDGIPDLLPESALTQEEMTADRAQ